MDISSKFSCFIIGEGTLPIQCAEILLEHDHTIYGMFSSDVAVRSWVQERGIPHIDPKNEDIITLLSQHLFDYLFSIVNPYILPKQILELPRRGAINYHDAPLPRYAGSYATTWAIMQGERVHGVTWHTMTEVVDAGDILKQYFFEIDDDETAFTLNAKCYDAAISSFAELIDDISCDRVSARKQDLNERTFFSRDKRPYSGCILSWNRSAHDIGAFVRALNFGPYPNPLGHPKLAKGMDFIIVSEIEVLNSMWEVPPGTVTHIDPGFVRVATIDGEIALRKLLAIDGQPLPIADFVAKFGLYEGYQFEELDREVATRITAYHAAICQHEAFWTKRLEALENITLPYVHRKTLHIQTARFLHVPMLVTGEMINLLENRFRTWGIGDFLLAAFAAYLARLTGVWSFDLGYRGSELKSDIAGLEGIFAAYVHIHMDIEYQQSFEEVLHAVQEQVKLVKQRRTYARDIMARYPVLRSKANMQGAHLPSIFVERIETLYDYKIPHDSELMLVIQEDGGECLWVYNAEVLDEESVVQMQHGLTTFLQGIASDPQRHISDLSLLTKVEQYHLLVEWNATHAEYPKDKCIHQLFEEQVERTPEVVAVVFRDEKVTYRELNRRANQLAHHLQHLEVGPEVLVGICAERSLDMVVGLLGILKAGGAYVPMDINYPSERLAFMLEDTQAPVLLTQAHLQERLPQYTARVVYLDADLGDITQHPVTVPVSAVRPNNLAYVIYTSGSTGKPKGVAIEHSSSVTFLDWAAKFFSPQQLAGVLASTSINFDLSVYEIFVPLCCGGAVILCENLLHLSTLLAAKQVTLVNTVPSILAELLKENVLPASVRVVNLAGEPLSRDLAQRIYQQDTVQQVFNLYGPTEDTTYSTWSLVQKGASDAPSIGRPLPGTQVYILDQHLHPVPVGVAGELYLSGDKLARCYLNRPELTAERFLGNPFSDLPGARIYKTGDLARYRSDGTIDHLGRLDFQMKLRGFRIELGEIEAVLGQHAAVRQAVVVAREDVPGDKRLVAYLVLHKNQSASVDELKDHVTKQVPAYMVPSAFVLLEALPLMPNGKVDRHALPAPGRVRPELWEAIVVPRTPIEEVVMGIWCQILGIERVSIHDDFFRLGGHSLLAMQVISRLRTTLQVEVSLHSFFEAPTIAKISKIIEQVKASDSQLQMSVPQPLSREARRKKLSSTFPTGDSSGSRGENQRRIQ